MDKVDMGLQSGKTLFYVRGNAFQKHIEARMVLGDKVAMASKALCGHQADTILEDSAWKRV